MPRKQKNVDPHAGIKKTARFVLEEKLDAAGFYEDDWDDVIHGVEVDEDGNVNITLTLTITSLDIEQAQEEGK